MDVLLDWPEMVASIFLIFGVVFSAVSRSLVVGYVVCFLMGLLFGRFWFKLQKTNRVQVFMSIALFLFGYLLGSFFVHARGVVIALVLGVVVGYYLHKYDIIST